MDRDGYWIDFRKRNLESYLLFFTFLDVCFWRFTLKKKKRGDAWGSVFVPFS